MKCDLAPVFFFFRWSFWNVSFVKYEREKKLGANSVNSPTKKMHQSKIVKVCVVAVGHNLICFHLHRIWATKYELHLINQRSGYYILAVIFIKSKILWKCDVWDQNIKFWFSTFFLQSKRRFRRKEREGKTANNE